MRRGNDDYAAIGTFLHSLGDYVVLRNHDFRANLGRGGDVDVLADDIPYARKRMNEALGCPWWVMRRTYVESCFYPWGHIDLTPRMEWHGATYIENQAIFASSSVSLFGFRQPRAAHEALICWFASLIWGGFFKERYASVITEAAQSDGEAFRLALIQAVGKHWGEKLYQLATNGVPEQSVAWVKPLRRALWFAGFRRHPLETLRGWISFWLREVRMRLYPPVPWLALLGPDGSGKSTVLAGVAKEWERLGLKTQFYHWRPEFLRPGNPECGPVTNPHGKMPRGWLGSLAKLAFLWLDWTIGFRFFIADKRARGVFVVFDRHYLDLQVDPLRYRYSGPQWLVRFIGYFLPQPDAVVLLDADAEVVHARKNETTLEVARELRMKYLMIVEQHPDGHVVDCSTPVEDVVDAVIGILVSVTAKHSDKKLDEMNS